MILNKARKDEAACRRGACVYTLLTKQARWPRVPPCTCWKVTRFQRSHPGDYLQPQPPQEPINLGARGKQAPLARTVNTRL